MGGGDLNAKKSWHPNTLKNQERVWKAEQAALEEKNRIAELQRERAQERDHAELTALARNRTSYAVQADNRLQWMYDKPDKKIQSEEYLLGKAIDASFDRSSQPEQDAIPALLRGSGPPETSGTGSDVQVDIARKLREDPLLLVKERERAARAALLNNPLQRRRLAELLRQDQEKRKEKKEKNKSKKKDKSLDNMITAKLSALGGESTVDVAALLAADSSDDSTPKRKHKKKKAKKASKKDKRPKKKAKKNKLKKQEQHFKHLKQNSDSSDGITELAKKYKSNIIKTNEEPMSTNNLKSHKKQDHRHSPDRYDRHAEKISKQGIESRKLKRKQDYSDSETISSDGESKRKKHSEHKDSKEKSKLKKERTLLQDKWLEVKHKTDLSRDRDVFRPSVNEGYRNKDDKRKNNSGNKSYRSTNVEREKTFSHEKKSSSLTEAERVARLEEMARAGVEHELKRGERVASQRAAQNIEEKRVGFPTQGRSEARALPTSLESRLQSNRHYIQRDKRKMNEHFARR